MEAVGIMAMMERGWESVVSKGREGGWMRCDVGDVDDGRGNIDLGCSGCQKRRMANTPQWWWQVLRNRCYVGSL